MTHRPRSAITPILLLLLGLIPATLAAQSAPKGSANGFRLYARALAGITANRVYCGLAVSGEFCTDSTKSSTVGGGYWPKNSPQQYIFNSGLWVAGKIAGSTEWAWAGDTTGGFFFDPKGTTEHGEGVDGFWSSTHAGDLAAWPAAARVPASGEAASMFAPALQGREVASDQDVWSLAWEGNPNFSNGRPHPLGVAMETRVLAWNYPAGNEDIVYFLTTFYNISSACAADYAGVRPELREPLRALGEKFQALNFARTEVILPVCGYTITDFYVGAAADMDVSSDAGANYSSANLPLALGYAYEHTFRPPEWGYALPDGIGTAPFTNGYGFAGIKFLRTPGAIGEPPAIRLYSNFGKLLNDPQNTYQLYRYLTGEINQGLGDGACNYVPNVDRICFIKNDTPTDMRFFQTAGPVATLPPGGAVTVATAYIFASAVASPGCPVAGCGGGAVDIKSEDPRILSNAAALAASGANLIDSMAGFRGYQDLNGDGEVQGNEFTAVRGSLIQKAQLAQAIFDAGFALPEAPEAPDFFLVPGDGKVSILWRPSRTEETGDGFFTSAAEPWSPTSPMYDPNYREFDVQGYRIYRGRTADPTRMTLLAQYDHDGEDTEGHSRLFRDYLGVVNPGAQCAPELGVETGCPVNFDQPALGSPYTVYDEIDPRFGFVQVKLGGRFLAANGTVYVTKADTAITGGGSGHPELAGSGVPFTHIDQTVVNDVRYFYAVTAFDLNSIQSAPSTLESPRVLKSATPMHAASNHENEGAIDIGVFGRGVNMSAAIPRDPSLDAANGTFSGPARPATGATIGFVGDFVKEVLSGSGELSMTLVGMTLGSGYDDVANTLVFDLAGAATTRITVPVVIDVLNATAHVEGVIDGAPLDNDRATRYGGSSAYSLKGAYSLSYPGSSYSYDYGRGCANAFAGHASGRCSYNGARWFDGANETFPHPTRGNLPNNAAPGVITNMTNAGSLTGVANVYEARPYQNRPNVDRQWAGVFQGAATAADYRLYWGAANKVDSVVDITHNVLVPFDTSMRKGYTWGFLTVAQTSGAASGDNRTGVLTQADLGCVGPMKDFPQAQARLSCPPTTTYVFDDSVSFGPVAIGNTPAADITLTPRPGQGFGIYLAGHFFILEMVAPTAPAAGTVWTLRTYTGAIAGGGGSVGSAGNLGAYAFTRVPSGFLAVGATLKAAYSVTNVVWENVSERDLDQVHTAPDPYYVTQGYALDGGGEGIKFLNLPSQVIVRIYSLSGVLIRVLEHNSTVLGGSLDWDIRSRDGKVVAPGVYFYALEAPSGARRVGRMTIVNNVR